MAQIEESKVRRIFVATQRQFRKMNALFISKRSDAIMTRFRKNRTQPLLVAAMALTVSLSVAVHAVEEEGWDTLFNGIDLAGWIPVDGYSVKDGVILCEKGGNLFTEKEFADFHFKFDFKLTPGANNGLGIRCPLKGHASSDGIELQILDNTAEKFANIKPYQAHGSIYGVVPAKRGFLKPVGEWNSQEVIAKGAKIKIVLNGETILDADLSKIDLENTMDEKEHPGLKRTSGHIGFLGHGSTLEFRNIRIKDYGDSERPSSADAFGGELV